MYGRGIPNAKPNLFEKISVENNTRNLKTYYEYTQKMHTCTDTRTFKYRINRIIRTKL